MIPYEPTKIDRPFAYNGARNDIPTEGGTETGNASLDLGFPPITSQPLSQGGIPPQRKDFNGILYLLSAYAYYAQSGGLYAWDKEIDYAVNCVVTYGNNIYICIANNGASTAAGVVEPGSNEDYWQTLYQYLQTSDSSTIGSPVNPIYINNGQMIASTATVGGDAQPVRLNNGIIEALTETIGAEDTPVFLKAGILTACTSSTGGGGIVDYKLAVPGYIKYEFGLLVQWGHVSKGTPVTITYPLAFKSASTYVVFKNLTYYENGQITERYFACYNKTATTCQTYTGSGGNDWIAIGY